MNCKKDHSVLFLNTDILCCRKVLKVVRLGEMDADQTVDSVREAELLSHLHNDYIVKVKSIFPSSSIVLVGLVL